MPDISIPKIPLGDWIENFIALLLDHFTGLTRAFAGVMDRILSALETGLLYLAPPITIALFTLFIWLATRKPRLTLFGLAGLSLLWNLGLWPAAMTTLTMVLTATATAVAMGIPLGILLAVSPLFRKAIMPFLDLMQTMPSFVYLIPAIPFFGLGKVSALIATVVFSLPPSIRLTCLGISQVPEDLKECADAFGSTRLQRLIKLELPLALPTILAGVNQSILLALSMVVVSAMIGAKGLGSEVWKAIQRLKMGSGFEAGLGIVILAICLDRTLQSLVAKMRKRTEIKTPQDN